MFTFESPIKNTTHSPLFQAKLKIGKPGDKFEREADNAATKVIRMQENKMATQSKCATTEKEELQMKAISDTSAGQIQMQPIEEEEDIMQLKLIQRQPIEEEEPIQMKRKRCERGNILQTKPEKGGVYASNFISQKIQSSRGKGAPLNSVTNQFMSNSFDTDFRSVKIHTGPEAVQMNQRMNTKAFTHSNNIFFNKGEYHPSSSRGKWLLAHELTHTIQQGGTDKVRMYRSPSSFNFGEKEDSFAKADVNNKSWIESISINLNKEKKDDNGYKIQAGSLNAKYFANAEKMADINMDVTGGSAELGKTDKVKNKVVHRIEGIGYNSGKYSGNFDIKKREGPNNRYSKEEGGKIDANMHYAIFYNKGEAIHDGSLSLSSHGCVHVDDAKQLNYHSVINKTKVTVT